MSLQSTAVVHSGSITIMSTAASNAFVLTILFLLQGSRGHVVRLRDPLQQMSGPPLTRNVSLDDRNHCSEGDVQPPNRVDTTLRVARLRQEMCAGGLDAYIVLTDDEHQSEYVSPASERLRYVSGFSGSWGVVVVTQQQQALWTDGRYHLQADSEMDCAWLLMKYGLPGVPTTKEWLTSVLWEGARVSADSKIMTASSWMDYAQTLSDAGIEMVLHDKNLVDIIWEDRPPYSTEPAFILPLNFAGKSWEDKVHDTRAKMSRLGASMLVLSALDEIAWLLNLRGNDIPYNPVFRSYLLVGEDRVQLFTPIEKVTAEIEDHLHTHHCDSSLCVQILSYYIIEDILQALEDDSAISSALVNPAASSYAIYKAIPATKRMIGSSPVGHLKSVKNPVEIQGMRYAHLKDAVALCEMLALLEREVPSGVYWDELSAAQKSEELRSEQKDYVQLSFALISAFGPNGAIVHYEPSPETNLPLDTTSLYLIDSGAQYMDGTTDVTRTVHWGIPTPSQVEEYTRVLQGHLDLGGIVFPVSTPTSLRDIEILARRPLYEVGLDYKHGTSHGIGMFLYVHESTLPSYGAGEFVSNEPGYYQDGEYGIRIENVMEVEQLTTQYNYSGPSLHFLEATLVPYEPKLIDTSMLTQKQCAALNSYHSRVRDEVGQEMLRQGRLEGYEWLLVKTNPLKC